MLLLITRCSRYCYRYVVTEEGEAQVRQHLYVYRVRVRVYLAGVHVHSTRNSTVTKPSSSYYNPHTTGFVGVLAPHMKVGVTCRGVVINTKACLPGDLLRPASSKGHRTADLWLGLYLLETVVCNDALWTFFERSFFRAAPRRIRAVDPRLHNP